MDGNMNNGNFNSSDTNSWSRFYMLKDWEGNDVNESAPDPFLKKNIRDYSLYTFLRLFDLLFLRLFDLLYFVILFSLLRYLSAIWNRVLPFP